MRQTVTDSSKQQNGTTSNVFDKKQFSLDNPASLWVITNKQRQLQPKSYAPNDLVVPNVELRLASSSDEMKMRKVAAQALEELFVGAEKDGLHLMLASGYRSYTYQTGLYSHYVKIQGKTAADTQSARPGHSEHQTGLAADVEPANRKCEIEECFGALTEGKWVANNGYKYGFIIRYAKDKQAVTGYVYEPWHLRYVGKALAEELSKQGNPTLEEFFNLEAAPDYP